MVAAWTLFRFYGVSCTATRDVNRIFSPFLFPSLPFVHNTLIYMRARHPPKKKKWRKEGYDLFSSFLFLREEVELLVRPRLYFLLRRAKGKKEKRYIWKGKNSKKALHFDSLTTFFFFWGDGEYQRHLWWKYQPAAVFRLKYYHSFLFSFRVAFFFGAMSFATFYLFF